MQSCQGSARDGLFFVTFLAWFLMVMLYTQIFRFDC